jgi:hypothetical protein
LWGGVDLGGGVIHRLERETADILSRPGSQVCSKLTVEVSQEGFFQVLLGIGSWDELTLNSILALPYVNVTSKETT